VSGTIAAALASVRERIATAGGDPSAITIVGVTKTHDSHMVNEAVAAGLSHLGENYVAELHTKSAARRDSSVYWHFLGALQSNKIAKVVAAASYIDSVSREREIALLSDKGATQPLCLEVDFTPDRHRSGLSPSLVPGLVDLARSRGLAVRGLMTVAPLGEEPQRAFSALRQLCDDLELPTCSMGMSADFEAAVGCGTTELRLGSILFGAREARTGLT
jgi:pyridoxal phosphate enzyme (YggS family)